MPTRGIRHPKCGLFDKPVLTELMMSSDFSMQTIQSTAYKQSLEVSWFKNRHQQVIMVSPRRKGMRLQLKALNRLLSSNI